MACGHHGLHGGDFFPPGGFFLAAVQLLVYAGAVLVLFLFVVMLLDIKTEEPRAPAVLGGSLLAGAFFALFANVVLSSGALPSRAPLTGSPEAVGQLLFRDYILPFELTSFLILAAVLSIVVLAKRDAA